MDFIAMDYETANRKRASACSVALVVVRQNRIVDSFYSLINPEDSFDGANIGIHGITPAMVQDAPNFATLWPHIQALFTPTSIVTAHNSPFDVSVLRRSLERYDLPVPHYQVIDTVKTSKALLPGLPNYRLDTVSAAMHIPLAHHHNALQDSYACARILLQQGLEFGMARLNPLLRTSK
ncbi:3'-5' exonuclease [Lacticaseibacillus nasuensis]|uniref:DNA polymerase III polC-type n=1 Tax=Lacticaseibacillus nasuensis JCM 17158 TaxID=1291734 RepID=A0A0R1JVZ1_9LACO|nr:3'-5' exonuclease [Lacticaseibacillus nasuensis]KRK72529.1 DNA polymerase III, epsilon subunit related 3-5 exonuclease [Lacticaseibacillus nasuensis JCM 17158]MCX2454733.1 3'-5' exonuclease [Lacticaseibacillus nasuensis]